MEVIYRNPLDRISGYAAAGREYLDCLIYGGVKVQASIFSLGEDPALLSPEEKSHLLSLAGTYVGPNATIIHNTVPDFWDRFPNNKNIGFMFWETDGFPSLWKPYLGLVDKLWVCWDETKKILVDVGIKEEKISIVPPVININTFNHNIVPLKLETGRSFNFMSLFQFSYRKGSDVLVKAYLEEFDTDEDVCLVIKSYLQNANLDSQRLLKDWFRKLKSSVDKKAYPKIVFRGDIVANNILPNFLRFADVFVLPTRGEGLGMPFLQSMACGVPCITTGWGAQCQFINNDNGWLVDYKKVNVSNMPHSPAYECGHKWAEPDKDHLRRLMREAFNNKEIVKEKGKKARKTIEDNYSYEKTCKKLAESL